MNRHYRETIEVSASGTIEELQAALPLIVPLAAHAIEHSEMKTVLAPLIVRQIALEMPKMPNAQITFQTNGTVIQALPNPKMPQIGRS